MTSGLSVAAAYQSTRVLVIFLATLLASTPTCRCSPNETDVRIESATMTAATTIGTASTPADVNFIDTLKEWIANAIDQSSPTLARKLLAADVSSECSLSLLKLVRGIKNLEPWALRLIDSSGKYPTGAFQVTRVDLGAFDECLETTVRDNQGYVSARGQYCSLLLFPKENTDSEDYLTPAIEMSHPRMRKFREYFFDHRIPAFRLGICTLNSCNEQELQNLVTAVIPPAVDLKVTGCVSADSPPITPGQKAIIACLAVTAFMIAVGTGLEIYTSGKATKCPQSVVTRVATSFSLLSNTRSMLNVSKDKNSDAHRFQFLHGIRFFSIVWIVVGHCYGNPSDVLLVFF